MCVGWLSRSLVPAADHAANDAKRCERLVEVVLYSNQTHWRLESMKSSGRGKHFARSLSPCFRSDFEKSERAAPNETGRNPLPQYFYAARFQPLAGLQKKADCNASAFR